MSAYLKAFAAMVGAVLAALLSVNSDNVLEPGEVVQVFLMGLGALAVYVVPNLPGYSVAKAVVAALTAGLTVLAAALTDAVGESWDITSSEWLMVVIAAGTAVGVWAAPKPDTGALDG